VRAANAACHRDVANATPVSTANSAKNTGVWAHVPNQCVPSGTPSSVPSSSGFGVVTSRYMIMKNGAWTSAGRQPASIEVPLDR
jgi:hypothetical protein